MMIYQNSLLHLCRQMFPISGQENPDHEDFNHFGMAGHDWQGIEAKFFTEYNGSHQ